MHILDSLNRGGTEVLALDVCRNARANDLDLTFVATGGGDLENDFHESGINFIRLQRRLPLDLSLVSELRHIIAGQNINVVHTHQAVEATHAYLATRGLVVKQVMTFHLCEADVKNRIALKLLVERLDAKVAVSQDLLKCLAADARFKIDSRFHVIHNGVDLKRLVTIDGDLRAELGLSSEHLLLGMVGNFYADRRKDQLTVCKALSALFARVPNVHFVFAGGSPDNDTRTFDECVAYCRGHKINDRVHFLGKRRDVPALLNSLDLFVFSSLKDSFGVAAVEAMMLGIPTVVSDIGALVEVSGNGQYARLFRTRDAEDLSLALLELISKPELRAELGLRGKEAAQRQFSIEAHIGEIKRLYKSLDDQRL